VKTIVWDADDVLNDLMHTWFTEWWLPDHFDCGVSYQDLVENPPHNILKVSLAEYLESLDAFRFSRLSSLKPVPEVREWFQLHGSQFRHIVLTAVPIHTAGLAAAWVFEHYGAWVRSFNLVPSRRIGENIPVYDQTKKDFLSWWKKADIIVDDSSVNIQSARELGLQTVLMPQPWNSSSLSLSAALSKLTLLTEEVAARSYKN